MKALVIALASVPAAALASPCEDAERARWAAVWCDREPTVCPLSRDALADGHVTPAEFQRITRQLQRIDLERGVLTRQEMR